MKIQCPKCHVIFLPSENIQDINLPPANRTQANLWKSMYFEMQAEVVKANKGIKRLRKRLNRDIKEKD